MNATDTRFEMLRRFVKSFYIRLWKSPRVDRTYRHLSAADTFRDVYRTKVWGDGEEAFWSGAGSHGPVSEIYCASVVAFILDHRVRSVVDLGCGDFAIGRRIVEASGVRYTGIDVVPELIQHHRNTVCDPRVRFLCSDITHGPLPPADLYLLRQVLQHLSNREIANVLANFTSTSRALISEDVPAHPRWFNVDKCHGPNLRSSASGVYLDRAPFSLPVTELWNFSLSDTRVLRTVLLDRTSFPGPPLQAPDGYANAAQSRDVE